nr:hypothetical protein [Tanacetum cinerariifolium]
MKTNVPLNNNIGKLGHDLLEMPSGALEPWIDDHKRHTHFYATICDHKAIRMHKGNEEASDRTTKGIIAARKGYFPQRKSIRPRHVVLHENAIRPQERRRNVPNAGRCMQELKGLCCKTEMEMIADMAETLDNLQRINMKMLIWSRRGKVSKVHGHVIRYCAGGGWTNGRVTRVILGTVAAGQKV